MNFKNIFKIYIPIITTLISLLSHNALAANKKFTLTNKYEEKKLKEKHIQTKLPKSKSSESPS